MKILKKKVRTVWPGLLLFAGLVAVALALSPSPATSASPDFSISLSPSSQSCALGGRVTYVATVTALNGFNGTVSLTEVNTLNFPGNVIPSTITGSGSANVNVLCNKGEPSQFGTVVVRGTSGTLAHGATAQLFFQG